MSKSSSDGKPPVLAACALGEVGKKKTSKPSLFKDEQQGKEYKKNGGQDVRVCLDKVPKIEVTKRVVGGGNWWQVGRGGKKKIKEGVITVASLPPPDVKSGTVCGVYPVLPPRASEAE